MQAINAAYELLQSTGVLHRAEHASPESTSRSTTSPFPSFRDRRREMHKDKKAGAKRYRAVPDDFASGDGSWNLQSSLEWKAMVDATDQIRPEELHNPANHPLSHSKFFSMEEDATIYRMLRGGATVPQVARTLGKQATFIEKRLQNAQFKLRIQYLLRLEQRHEAAERQKQQKSREWKANLRSTKKPGNAPNTTRSALRRSPSASFSSADHLTFSSRNSVKRKHTWEPTTQSWDEQPYYADLSLEEKMRRDEAQWGSPNPRASPRPNSKAESSKLGRSYANYSRMFGDF